MTVKSTGSNRTAGTTSKTELASGRTREVSTIVVVAVLQDSGVGTEDLEAEAVELLVVIVSPSVPTVSTLAESST